MIRAVLFLPLLGVGCVDLGDIPLEVAMERSGSGGVASGGSVSPSGGSDAALGGQSGGDEPICGDVTVELRKLKFRPPTVDLCAGDSITFVNKDLVVHNIIQGTPEDASHGFESPKFGTGESWTLRFDEPGQTILYCGTHKKKMRDFVVTVW